MAITVDVVEGWTGDLDFTLKADGVAVDLTGMTVELILKDKDGATVTTTGDVTVPTPASGLVRFNPDAADLDGDLQPYRAHWKVTDGSGKIVFFPSGSPDVIRVFKQAGF